MDNDRSSSDAARERLIEATMRLLEHDGLPGVTATALARETGFSVSATNYRFGSQAALIEEAYRVAGQRIAGWWQDAAHLLPPANEPRVAGGWLATMIVRACNDPGYPRLVLQEMLQAAPGNEAIRIAANHAISAARQVFRDAGRQIGLENEASDLLGCFAQGAIFSYSDALNWAIDGPMLADAVTRLMERMQGKRRNLAGWDGWCRIRAAEPIGPETTQLPDSVHRMQNAAVQILAQGGPGSLTHRAVASKANCTLANAVYHFPTKDYLLRSTLMHVFYDTIRAGAIVASAVGKHTVTAEMLATEAAGLFFNENGVPLTSFMAGRAMHLAASRSPELHELLAQLRVAGELSTLRSLHALSDTNADRLDAHLVLMIMAGINQSLLCASADGRYSRTKDGQMTMLRLLFLDADGNAS